MLIKQEKIMFSGIDQNTADNLNTKKDEHNRLKRLSFSWTRPQTKVKAKQIQFRHSPCKQYIYQADFLEQTKDPRFEQCRSLCTQREVRGSLLDIDIIFIIIIIIITLQLKQTIIFKYCPKRSYGFWKSICNHQWNPKSCQIKWQLRPIGGQINVTLQERFTHSKYV